MIFWLFIVHFYAVVNESIANPTLHSININNILNVCVWNVGENEWLFSFFFLSEIFQLGAGSFFFSVHTNSYQNDGRQTFEYGKMCRVI